MSGKHVGISYYPWPCMECKERNPKCHGDCERYRKAKEEYEKMKEKQKAENDVGFSFAKDMRLAKRKLKIERFHRNK